LQHILALEGPTSMLRAVASLRISTIGITFRSASEHALYSASVVERAVSVCNLLAHMIGHPM
jgi:hypothetical protein